MKITKSLTIGVGLVVALVLGGVAGYAVNSADTTPRAPSSGSSSLSAVAARADATRHNQQDTSFAQQMIVHHRQAVAMAGMARGRSTDAQVLSLAASIEAAQSPEINKMTGWLRSWGVTPATGEGSMDMSTPSMDMSSGSMASGMMSGAEMAKLAGLRGNAFDAQFLTMMTAHHDGAIAMSHQELVGGQYADALGLAASIVVSQQGEISHMQQLRKS